MAGAVCVVVKGNDTIFLGKGGEGGELVWAASGALVAAEELRCTARRHVNGTGCLFCNWL